MAEYLIDDVSDLSNRLAIVEASQLNDRDRIRKLEEIVLRARETREIPQQRASSPRRHSISPQRRPPRSRYSDQDTRGRPRSRSPQIREKKIRHASPNRRVHINNMPRDMNSSSSLGIPKYYFFIFFLIFPFRDTINFHIWTLWSYSRCLH